MNPPNESATSGLTLTKPPRTPQQAARADHELPVLKTAKTPAPISRPLQSSDVSAESANTPEIARPEAIGVKPEVSKPALKAPPGSKAEPQATLPPRPKPPAPSFPNDINGWKVRPYKTGCVATLVADKGANGAIDPFQPDHLAIYLYHEPKSSYESGVPDWFGFVAPGGGEMSARLISPQGDLIRGVTGSTGLQWQRLAKYGQPDMELRLTQCNLKGECRSRVGSLDLAGIETVSAATYKCATRSR